MGKHRFRLSDMMPNAWFYKLKDMNNHPHKNHHHHHPPLTNPTKKAQTLPPVAPPSNQQNQKQLGPLIPNRASYYFPSNSPIHPKVVDTTSPRNLISSSSTPRRPPRTRKLPTTHHPLPTTTTTSPTLPLSSSVSESESDVIHSYCICNPTPPPPPPKLDIVLDLRPIITKKPNTKKQNNVNLNPTAKSTTGHSAATQSRLLLRSSSRTPAGSPNRKVRVAAARRPPSGQRKRRGRGIIDESFAVVKSSSDPKSDFRESMVEMILANKLTAPKDLEDLLACYLSLNSNEYHHVIVNVFQEIWLDITSFVS